MGPFLFLKGFRGYWDQVPAALCSTEDDLLGFNVHRHAHLPIGSPPVATPDGRRVAIVPPDG